MRFVPCVFGILIASLLSSGAQPAPDEAAQKAALQELQTTISKLVDVQSLESKERLDWEAKRASLHELFELHQQELKLLNEELAKAGKTAPAHQQQTEVLEAQIESLKEARQLAAEAVARNLARLKQLTEMFPKPLLDEIEGEMQKLFSWTPAVEPRDALQAMLTILDRAEQFNRRFTRSTEVQDGSEVQVLYLGLAQAYYLDRKGKAGVGRPTAEGWKWESMPGIRDELNAAFEIMDKKQPPTTVTLPLKLD